MARTPGIQKIRLKYAWRTPLTLTGVTGLNLLMAGAQSSGSLLENELDDVLRKELFAYSEDRIAVRFEYEYRNENGLWFRAYGNENWVFNENGLMKKRYASINDWQINESDRRITINSRIN